MKKETKAKIADIMLSILFSPAILLGILYTFMKEGFQIGKEIGKAAVSFIEKYSPLVLIATILSSCNGQEKEEAITYSYFGLFILGGCLIIVICVLAYIHHYYKRPIDSDIVNGVFYEPESNLYRVVFEGDSELIYTKINAFNGFDTIVETYWSEISTGRRPPRHVEIQLINFETERMILKWENQLKRKNEDLKKP